MATKQQGHLEQADLQFMQRGIELAQTQHSPAKTEPFLVTGFRCSDGLHDDGFLEVKGFALHT